MMVHQEDTLVARRAVVRPGRLDVVTVLALLLPEGFEGVQVLGSVPQQFLYLSRSPVIFVVVCVKRSFVV